MIVRLKKKFLFFPMKLGNDRRWLKTVYIVQKYVRTISYDAGDWRKWVTYKDYGFIKLEEFSNVMKSMENDFHNCLRIYNKEEKNEK